MVEYTGYNTKTIRVIMDESKTIDIALGVYKPEEAPNGIYAYCQDGLMYESKVYDAGKEAIGIGIKTDKYSFIARPTSEKTYLGSFTY